MLRPLPVSDRLALRPGATYFVSFAAPDALLDAVTRRPDWASAATRHLLEHSGARVEFLGGGVAWESVNGRTERTFMVRLRVIEPEPDPSAPVIEAGVSLRAIVAALVAVFGIVASLAVVRVVEQLTDPERRPLTEVVAGWSPLALALAFAVGVVGLSAARWVLAQ